MSKRQRFKPSITKLAAVADVDDPEHPGVGSLKYKAFLALGDGIEAIDWISAGELSKWIDTQPHPRSVET